MGGWPAGHPGSSTPQCPNRAEPPQHTPPALLQNVQSGRATRKIGLSHPPNRAEPTPSPPNGLATWLGHPDKNRAEPFFLNLDMFLWNAAACRALHSTLDGARGHMADFSRQVRSSIVDGGRV